MTGILIMEDQIVLSAVDASVLQIMDLATGKEITD